MQLLADAAVPAREALTELVLSRQTLERHLRRPVQFLAQVLSLVRQAGYVLAVTTAPADVQRASEPFLLHRYEVLASTGVAGLQALLGDR